MIYLNTFNSHASYEEKLNVGGVDISLPNVSYCEDVKDVHYNPYNTVEFYVGKITGTTSQTVKIYTDNSNNIPIQVNEGNKWYSYVLQKNKGLYKISGNTVKKVVVKADINTNRINIIPSSTVEVSFKGSNTSNVTDMHYMFNGCRSITSLDLRNFNTSNVTDMSGMFYNCNGLTSLDVSNFNTSNVTNMGSMFHNCNGLTSLDVSRFDTSKVTYMNNMFIGCSCLTSLDVSNFKTSNVTDMGYMFKGCSGLTSLNLSSFDTSNVTNMSDVFNGCSKLKTITMIGCSIDTVNKIQNQLTKDNITGVTITT